MCLFLHSNPDTATFCRRQALCSSAQQNQFWLQLLCCGACSLALPCFFFASRNVQNGAQLCAGNWDHAVLCLWFSTQGKYTRQPKPHASAPCLRCNQIQHCLTPDSSCQVLPSSPKRQRNHPEDAYLMTKNAGACRNVGVVCVCVTDCLPVFPVRHWSMQWRGLVLLLL